MNTRKGITKCKNFRFLLDIGCSSTVVMVRLITKVNPKDYDVIKFHRQASIITNDMKFEIYLTLPELSATKIVTWNFNMDESAKGR